MTSTATIEVAKCFIADSPTPLRHAAGHRPAGEARADTLRRCVYSLRLSSAFLAPAAAASPTAANAACALFPPSAGAAAGPPVMLEPLSSPLPLPPLNGVPRAPVPAPLA